MKSPGVQSVSASPYHPAEYWAGLAEKYDSADPDGFAPVLHPGAPDWFNRLIDSLQLRAMKRALGVANLAAGARILDVGCGTGRWLRRYRELGFRPVGVDRTPAMLELARRRDSATPLVAGEAHRLPFASAQFDCVSDVTVVQHIPSALQPVALAEMMRVLAPGGKLILMELIRGEGAHIFPRAPQDWIQKAAENGAKLLSWFGQEYLFLDRMFVRGVQVATGRAAGPANPQNPLPTLPKAGAARRMYWTMRRMTAPFSAWTDSVVEKIVPGSLATHGVFVFQK
jgi:ubiquinone/menaquinone biosynthesis C-methylase UbiE